MSNILNVYWTQNRVFRYTCYTLQGGVNSLNKKYFETLLRYKSKTSI